MAQIHYLLRVDMIFLYLFCYFTLSLSINTYKDHSLHFVVRRPYSGLTFSLICFFAYIYICGLPRSHS